MPESFTGPLRTELRHQKLVPSGRFDIPYIVDGDRDKDLIAIPSRTLKDIRNL